MKSFGKIASSLAIAALLAAPIAASVPEAGTTLSKAAVKAIGSKMRSGVVVRLSKKVTKKNNVELAQVEGAAGAGAAGGGAGGAGAAGAGAAGAGAGAAGAGAAAAGAGAAAGGLGVAGAVAGVAAAAGATAAATSGGGDNSP